MQDQDRQEQVAGGQQSKSKSSSNRNSKSNGGVFLPHLPNFFPACSIPHWAVGSGQ